MNYSLVQKIQSMTNLINDHSWCLKNNFIDFIIDRALLDNNLKYESPIDIISCLVNFAQIAKEKEIEIKISDNFIDKFLDVLIKLRNEKYVVDSINLVDSLKNLITTLEIKLTDKSRLPLLDLLIKNKNECNLITLIQKFISLDKDYSKQFSFNEKDGVQFLNLLKINQDHYNVAELIEYFEFFLDNDAEYSENNEQTFLSLLIDKIKTGEGICLKPIKNINKIIKKF